MPQIFANNATSTLSAALGIADVTAFIQPGQGGRFPVIAGGDFMYCTLEDASGNIEIVRVTAHVAAAQSLTIVRAQQGTAARAWAIGDLFELRFTAAEATAWEADIDALEASRSRKDGQAYTGVHDFTGGQLKVAAPAAGSDAVTKTYADNLGFSAALPAQAGNAGRVIRTNGAVATWGEWWGPVNTLTVANNGAVLAVRKRYEFDSSGGAFSVTLPAMGPEDWIMLADAKGRCSDNPVTVNLAGQSLRGDATSLIVDSDWFGGVLIKNATDLVLQ